MLLPLCEAENDFSTFFLESPQTMFPPYGEKSSLAHLQ
jgi:hypothetical protein